MVYLRSKASDHNVEKVRIRCFEQEEEMVFQEENN
jgi:hypothetical protein